MSSIVHRKNVFMIDTLFLVVIVIVSLALVAWFSLLAKRRVNTADSSYAIVLRSRLSLSRTEQLFVVECTGKHYFIGVSAAGMTVLNASLDVPPTDEGAFLK